MNHALLLQHAREALVLSIAVALPVLVVAAIVGLVVAALQAASQVQDPTISHLPRLLAVAAALALLAPWMGREIASFAEHMLMAAAAPPR
jgi:flagellar biosynthesis protein FliQ